MGKKLQIINLIIVILSGFLLWFISIGFGILEWTKCFSSGDDCIMLLPLILAIIVTIYFVFLIIFLAKSKKDNLLTKTAHYISIIAIIILIIGFVMVAIIAGFGSCDLFCGYLIILTAFIDGIILTISFLFFLIGFFKK